MVGRRFCILYTGVDWGNSRHGLGVLKLFIWYDHKLVAQRIGKRASRVINHQLFCASFMPRHHVPACILSPRFRLDLALPDQRLCNSWRRLATMWVTSVCYLSACSHLFRGISALHVYSHTFEKRSSLATNFEPVLVGGPVLLVHPPNSSSAATFGCVTNPPDAPGTIEVLANEPPVLVLPPPQPKSLAGGGMKAGLFGAAGSGAAQALPPHTSAPERVLEFAMAASGLVVVAGAGEDLG